MKKITICFSMILFFFLLSVNYVQAQGCDRGAARTVLQNLKAMASYSVEKGVVYYSWIDDWHSFTLPQKNGLLTAAANADACLEGKARKIYFHYRGEKVAEADPTWGLKVIK